MGRKAKKQEEIKNPEYLNKLTDDQILEYVLHEIRANLPNPNLPLILTTEDKDALSKKVGAYYATVGKIVREGEFAYQNIHITYEEYINGRWLSGGGFIVNLKISDYDCFNTAPNRYQTHPNETWVDYVDGILQDKEYRDKAEKYMKSTYPEFFEERKNSSRIYWDGEFHDADEKACTRI